jgi:hypothetical protein
MTSTNSRPIRFRPLRRVILGLLGAALVGLLIVVAYFLIVRWYTLRTANHEFDQIAAQLDQADPKWRWDEIEASRPTLPSEQNGFLVMDAALQKLPPSWTERPLPNPAPGDERVSQSTSSSGPSLPDRIWNLPLNQTLPEALVTELLAEWRSLDVPLAEARRLIDFPQGRAPLTLALDPKDTPLPQIDQLQRIALLLRLDALAQIENKNPDAALNALCALLNAAHSFVDEPTVLLYLVRTRVLQNALGTAERVLARGEPSKDRLEAFARLLDRDDAEADASLRAGLRGDRALFVCEVERLADGTIPPIEKSFYGRCREWLITRPLAAENRAPSLQLLTQLVNAVGLPRPQREQALADLEAERKRLAAQPTTKLAAQLCPPGAIVFDAHDRCVAAVRCARAALAAELFRREHGQWPQSLGDLVPAYLPAVPLDPFTDKPLQMELLGDGLVVSSVGPEGEEVANIKQVWDRYNPRPFFRLWNADKRGVKGQ